MPDPIDPLLLGNVPFAREYLGIGIDDLFQLSRLLDDQGWKDYWASIRKIIESDDRLNSVKTDEQADRDSKAKLKDRAQDVMLELQRIASDLRGPAVAETELQRELREYSSTLQDIEKRIYTQETTRVGHVFFGPQNLDPTDIRVQEVASIQRIQTVRADTEVAIKLPKTMTQINMDMVFSGVNDINHRLRHLIGSLVASPITTIENPFLTAMLVNHYSTPELTEAIKQRVLTTTDADHAVASIRASTDGIAESFELTKEIFQSDDLALEWYRQIHLNEQLRVGTLGTAANANDGPEAEPLPSMGVSIPVAFSNIVISTDTDAVDTVHVRLTFIRMNPSAFGIYGIEYRDANGNRTADIAKCPWLSRYVEWAYLDPNNNADPDLGKNPWYLEDYKAHLTEGPDLKIRWQDILDPLVTRHFPKEVSNFVVNSVQLAFGMKLAILPVIGAKYPAIQVMGRGTAEGRIVLQTTSLETMRELTVMKDHLDAISRNVAGQFRDEYLEIDNSILGLVGARQFLVRSIEGAPIPNTVGAYQYEMNLLQSRYTLNQQQPLLLRDASIPVGAYKDFWDHLWTKYQSAREKMNYPFPGFAQMTEEEHLTMRVIFGSGSILGGRNDSNSTALQGNGLITEEVFTAAIFKMANEDLVGPKDIRGSGEFYNNVDKVDDVYNWIGIGAGRDNAKLPVSTTNSRGEVGSANISVFEAFHRIFQADVSNLDRNDIDFSFERGGSRTHRAIHEKGHLNSWHDARNGIRQLNRQAQSFLEYAIGIGGAKSAAKIVGQRTDRWRAILTHLTSARFRRLFGFTKEMWDQLFDVMMNPLKGPKVLRNANNVFNRNDKPQWGSKNIWSRESLTKAQMSFTYLLNSAAIEAFSFDWNKYMPAEGLAEELVPTSTDIPEAVARRLRSNYPDIPLPTYDQFFANFRGSDLKYVDPQHMVTDNVSGKRTPLWTRFAPTYSDLGIEPPEQYQGDVRGVFRLARKIDDVMEPGFWFYHQKIKGKMISRAERALRTPGQRPEDIARSQFTLTVDIDTEQFLREEVASGATRGAAEARLKKTLAARIQELVEQDEKSHLTVKEAKKNGIFIDVIDSTNGTTAYYRPANRAGGNVDWKVDLVNGGKAWITNKSDHPSLRFDRRSPEHNIGMTAKVMQGLPDNLYSMARAYPAIRIYFVEWDDNVGRFKRDRADLTGRRVRMLDDLYTSNAIISCQVTHSKNDASVAVITILNTVGTFDTDSFLLPSEAKRTGIRGPDDEGEDYLRRMRLQTGTGIMVQMGYSADINGLETVFTGQIAEIQSGKTVTIVAQGYKTELDREVNIAINDDTGPREAIQQLLELGQNGAENLTPHLGRIMDRRGLWGEEAVRTWGRQLSEDTGVLGLEGRDGLLSRLTGANVNSISRNVWVETNLGTQNYAGQAFQNLLETLGGRDKEWRFQNKTAWQGLQEMSRHWAGTICAVRPYGAESTVFFGYPDQLYQYKTISARSLQTYLKAVKPERIAASAGLFANFMAPFWASKYGTTDKQIEARQQAILKKLHAGSNIGNSIGGGGFLGLGDPYVAPGRLGQLISENSTSNSNVLDGLFGDEGGSYTAWVGWATKQPQQTHITNFDDIDPDAYAGTVFNNAQTIPMYNSMKLDFTADWAHIVDFNAGLAKFLFAHFFNLTFSETSTWGGQVEGKWQRAVEIAMQPLFTETGESTNAWAEWIRSTGVYDPDGLTNFYEDGGGDFDIDYDDVRDSSPDLQVQIQKGISLLQSLRDEKKITEEEYSDRAKRLLDIGKKLQEIGEIENPRAAAVGAVGAELEALAGKWNIDLRGKNPVALINFIGLVNSSAFSGTFGKALFTFMPFFRLFIHFVAKWMNETQGKTDSPHSFRAADTQELASQMSALTIPPGFKNFRNYHTIFSGHDIIDNSIVASMSEMYNSILVRCPKDALPGTGDVEDGNADSGGSVVYDNSVDWVSWPQQPGGQGLAYHPNIKKSSRKLGVALEPNANGDSRRSNVLLSNMAAGLRPMYRGSIKFVGKNVFPWDSIVISDEYNSMYGVIEADRVTHEFTGSLGWVTTVEPHAYCHVNNPWALWHLTNYNDYAGMLETLNDAIFIASIALAVFTGGASLAAGAAVAGRVAFRGAARTILSNAGTYAAKSTSKEIILRTATVRAAAKVAQESFKRGLIESAKTAGASIATSASRRAVGRHLANNWLPTVIAMGRTIGWFALLNQGLPPAARLLHNLTTKARVNNAFLPVDFRPLTSKGNPLTAGLNLHDADIMTYGEKLDGTYERVRDSIADWLTANTEDEPLVPTNVSGR